MCVFILFTLDTAVGRYPVLESLTQYFGINIADFPVLKKLYDDVAAQPNINKWLEERPKTDY